MGLLLGVLERGSGLGGASMAMPDVVRGSVLGALAMKAMVVGCCGCLSRCLTSRSLRTACVPPVEEAFADDLLAHGFVHQQARDLLAVAAAFVPEHDAGGRVWDVDGFGDFVVGRGAVDRAEHGDGDWPTRCPISTSRTTRRILATCDF